MTLAEIDWKQFLKPGSEQPPDVSFSITDKDERALSKELSGVTLTQKPVVLAHKFLLAGASPVFRRQFLGSLKDNSDVVLIKETTLEAFKTMIDYLYNPPGQNFTLNHMGCPQDLCEVYNIAERYQLENLKLIVYSVLSALFISSENLLFTAATAKHWYVFPNVSELLLDKCATFLAEKMKTAEDVFQLMLHTKESYPDADPDLLQELLRMNAEKPKTCSNCKRGLAHCVHGQSVTGLEDPPVLAKDVRVRSTGYRGIVTIESLYHRKASRSPYQSNTPEEVGNYLLELVLKKIEIIFFYQVDN